MAAVWAKHNAACAALDELRQVWFLLATSMLWTTRTHRPRDDEFGRTCLSRAQEEELEQHRLQEHRAQHLQAFHASVRQALRDVEARVEAVARDDKVALRHALGQLAQSLQQAEGAGPGGAVVQAPPGGAVVQAPPPLPLAGPQL